ncbi:MAG: hypothetical protein KKA42_10515 [candidate division Zixibacteria bacterium]|nr:hypothetical protein [candidate division Zixibacteria bacterium]
MRSSKSLILVGVLMFGALALMLSGCSGDDDPPTIDTQDQDPLELTLVSPMVTANVDSTIGVVLTGLRAATLSEIEIEDGLDDILFGPTPPDSSTTVSDYWHVSYLTETQAGSSGSIQIMVDSIQFRGDGSPNISAMHSDAMTYVHHNSVTASDTTVSYNDKNVDANVTFSGIDEDATSVNGSFSYYSHEKEVSDLVNTRETWDVDGTITSLTFSKSSGGWQTGCPSSGTVQLSVAYSLQQGDATPVTNAWEITLTFENGSFTAAVTYNQLSDSYDEHVCDLAS